MPYYYHGPVTPGGRKPTGGKIRVSRGKRKSEAGRSPAFTTIGEKRLKFVRVRGGSMKLRLISGSQVNVAIGKGITRRAKILGFIENPSDKVLSRRGIITRGALVKTEFGIVRITSRAGQHGILNGVLAREEVAS
ncbi:MAG: 30S ribosomal protein S8e [Candidatus Korarchaeum sp.]|nr:30S ribosomal protein S8e [Candidatus Korarchaeum sp.]MDW8035468.1 30S ribosomal protein S8e [Candidatus Korarchaeum sp.]